MQAEPAPVAPLAVAAKTPAARKTPARRVLAAEASPPLAPRVSYDDPYSEAALAALMADPKAAFKAGGRAMQNSPVAASAGASATPKRRTKKSAAELHAALHAEASPL